MTYSIVARDPQTGEMGVAVQTALPGVGRLCPWAESGIGAVATQSLVRVSHGPSGLILMRNGHTAPQALAAVVAGDANAQVRQIGMIDRDGQTAAYTGSSAIPFAGHKSGDNFSVQANMMLKATVPDAMASAFENTHGKLVTRMLAALRAAQDEGGDFRGQQSAALKIVSSTISKNTWDGVLYDVRVDDHAIPVAELTRICQRHMAYKIMDEAEELASKGDFDGALKRAQDAIDADPEELQLRYWFALATADAGQFARVEGMLREVFKQDPVWVECTRRYAASFPFQTEGLAEKIIALAD